MGQGRGGGTCLQFTKKNPMRRLSDFGTPVPGESDPGKLLRWTNTWGVSPIHPNNSHPSRTSTRDRSNRYCWWPFSGTTYPPFTSEQPRHESAAPNEHSDGTARCPLHVAMDVPHTPHTHTASGTIVLDPDFGRLGWGFGCREDVLLNVAARAPGGLPSDDHLGCRG